MLCDLIYTIDRVRYKKKVTLNFPSHGLFSMGLKNESDVVNEPLVFESLQFYCIYFLHCYTFFY